MHCYIHTHGGVSSRSCKMECIETLLCLCVSKHAMYRSHTYARRCLRGHAETITEPFKMVGGLYVRYVHVLASQYIQVLCASLK